MIEYELAISRIRVFAEQECERSQSGYYHPHVDTNGAVCWGNDGGVGVYNASLGNPFEALFLTADFLKTVTIAMNTIHIIRLVLMNAQNVGNMSTGIIMRFATVTTFVTTLMMTKDAVNVRRN